MDGTFQVIVRKDYLAFSAAHFITFEGHKCESLHGHNYRVGVVVEGAVDPECQFVLDFAVLKDILRPLVDAIDHRVLLPTASPKLSLRAADDGATEVVYRGSVRYRFPTSDCAPLPVSNTTAEMLAEYFALAVDAALSARGVRHVSRLEIEVEESPGQAAVYRMEVTRTA